VVSLPRFTLVNLIRFALVRLNRSGVVSFTGFCNLRTEAKERDLEDALTDQLTKFLIELGQWFAFMGRQYKLSLGEKECFVDLLFYHTRLKRYIVIDLKMDEFEPEFKGKMEFYLTLADEQLRGAGDEPSIGLILCKTKNGLVAEYALRDSSKPIGIAEYTINESLPKDIKGELPTIEELETEMGKGYDELKSPAHKKLDALKEKLAAMKANEIKQPATFDTIEKLFQKELKPLFDLLLEKLHEADELFFSNEYSWQGMLTGINNMDMLAKDWKERDFSNCYHTPQFNYVLKGCKSAGVESFDVMLQLTLHISPWWYGFSLMGYDNQQPFIKKMYHEELTKADRELICETILSYLADDIERRLSYIQGKSEG
jgi:YhcG PDDEXK nuclease domain